MLKEISLICLIKYSLEPRVESEIDNENETVGPFQQPIRVDTQDMR